MTYGELMTLAQRARHGDEAAVRQMRKAAEAAGFYSQAGGWVYWPDRKSVPPQTVTQGWVGFAWQLSTGHIPSFHVRRMVARVTDKREAWRQAYAEAATRADASNP